MNHSKTMGLITSWDDVPIVMDLPWVSRIVAMTIDTLKRLARDDSTKRLPAYKVGSEWRVNKDDLREWMENQKQASAAKL